MGTAAVDFKQKIKIGNTRALYIGTVTPSASYATGGETLDLTAATGFAGPSKPDSVLIGTQGGNTGELASTGTKVLLRSGGTTEVASTTDLSALKFDLWVIGPG